MQVSTNEELKARIQQSSGEETLAFGWGVKGIKNVYVTLTPSSLFLEFVSITGKSLDTKRITLETLEFAFAVAGDASTPGFMKFNAHSRFTDKITGTLLYKERFGKISFILFRKRPEVNNNDKAAFRITEKLTGIKPELVYLPDLKAIRKNNSEGGFLRRFILLSLLLSLVFTITFGFLLAEGWSVASIVGFSTGIIIGGIFAPLMPIFKRMLTGEG